MTELHWGLIGLAIIVVACVVIYNSIQENRYRKITNDLLGKPGDPMASIVKPAPGGGQKTAARIEPTIGATPSDTPDEESPLSPNIDYIAIFKAVAPVSAARIVESTNGLALTIRKPVLRTGYNAQLSRWESIAENGKGAYDLFHVGMQLVDRQGAVSGDEISVFHQAVQRVAEEFSAVLQGESVEDALLKAVQLDVFCESVDIQVSLHVVAGVEPFQGKKLKRFAESESAGMTLESDGRFVARDAHGHILYSLINREPPVFSDDSLKILSARGVTFLLDVPRTSDGERAFGQMLAMARNLAAEFSGQLVDDKNREFSEDSLKPVREHLVKCQAAMAEKGLPAGGVLARRLFS